MSEIAIASREQSEAVEQMALAITQIERASEKNADLVQDAGTMADLLAQHATHMMELLKDFKLDHASSDDLSQNSHAIVVTPQSRAIPNRTAIEV